MQTYSNSTLNQTPKSRPLLLSVAAPARVTAVLCGLCQRRRLTMTRKLIGNDGKAINIPDGWRGFQGSDVASLPYSYGLHAFMEVR